MSEQRDTGQEARDAMANVRVVNNGKKKQRCPVCDAEYSNHAKHCFQCRHPSNGPSLKKPEDGNPWTFGR